MKKNLLIKIVLALLIVLLAFSVVACGGKKAPDDDPKTPGTTDKAVKMADIADFLGRFAPLADQIDLIENEMHFDIALALKYDEMQYSVQLKGDIYGETPANNQLAIIMRDDALASGNVKLEAYLKEGVIYLNQKLTSTQGATKFSKLDALEINKNLSKLPGMLNDLGLGLGGTIEDLQETVEGLGLLADGILKEYKALTIKEETDSYVLGIDPAGLGGLLVGLVDVIAKDGFGDMQGLVDFALDFVFGVDSIDALATAEADNFPTIEISALKEENKTGANANGLKIYYEGDLDKATTKKEVLEIGIIANVDNDGVLPGTKGISFPNFDNYKEGVLKASLTIDLGVKDLYLKADVFADPDFTNKQTNPTAYLAAYNKLGTKIADLDALYDGEWLYFDLAGLYAMLDVDAPATGTQYKIAFDFPPTNEVVTPPETAAEDEADDEFELPFKLNPNFLMVMLGNIGELVDIVKDAALEQELSLSISHILTLAEGALVENVPSIYMDGTTKISDVAALEELLYVKAPGYLSSKTDYTAAEKTNLVKALLKKDLSREATLADYLSKDSKQKAYTDQKDIDAAYKKVYGLLDKLYPLQTYGKTAIIDDLNELLAEFAVGYEEEPAEPYTAEQLKDFAQAVIKEFSGVDVSVDDIINPGTTPANDVYIFFGLLENKLGIELDISTGADKATKVLNIKVELDIVAETPSYELPTADKYANALDLDSVADPENEIVGNIYYVGEEKNYVILDELLKLLDAYKAIGAPQPA